MDKQTGHGIQGTQNPELHPPNPRKNRHPVVQKNRRNLRGNLLHRRQDIIPQPQRQNRERNIPQPPDTRQHKHRNPPEIL